MNGFKQIGVCNQAGSHLPPIDFSLIYKGAG
ncbi:hypothetical protein CFU_0303 [Collimonas fungivorans Ter331]|uniref:Uncharacterized protein n=1 Tax=Collimonas fungivorans (strain Ter331) TaxID=1005048 RepID=G0A868_COLFT|nr:hypothetical protein CFU_0303 [Collimonas fungivorans Ter331]